jgi:hypothetical protein
MDNTPAQPPAVRRAAAADAAALTRLREVDFAWFRDKTEARVINLNATRDGMTLYRSLGFTEPRYPALQLRLARPG